jgi:PAS domain S-box-containing protein
VTTLAAVVVLGRAQHRLPAYADELRAASVLALLASGCALLWFRHTLFPVRRAVFAAAFVAVAVAAGGGLAAGVPAGRASTLGATAALLAVVGIWAACVADSVGAFWRAARGRPAVQRKRLRALAVGYVFILVAILLLFAFPPLPAGAAIAREVVVALAVPLLLVGFETPAWLRRVWREVEEQALRHGMQDLLSFAADRRATAGHALNWALRLVGADSGFIATAEGVLAVRRLSQPQVEDLLRIAASATSPSLTPLDGPGGRYLIALPLDGEGGGTLAVVSGSLTPIFGADEVERLRSYAAAIGTALERGRLDHVLADQTARFESLLGALSDLGQGLVIGDGDRVVYVNEAFLALTGLSVSEVADLESMIDVIAPDEREVVDRLTRRALRGERVPEHYETTILRADGRRVEVEVAAKRFVREGRPFVVHLFRDTTERARAERELRREKAVVELLQTVAVAANQATNVEEALQVCIDNVCDFTGWPVGHAYLVREDDPTVLEAARVWHLEDPVRYGAFREVTEGTSFRPFEYLPGRILASGKPLWVPDVTQGGNFRRTDQAGAIGVRAGFGFPILAGTEVVGVLEFYSPHWVEPDDYLLAVMPHVGAQLGRVVERKRALEWLRRSEAALAEAQQIARLGSWEIDMTRDEVVWSQTMFDIFEVSPAEFPATAQAFTELVHPDDRDVVDAAAAAALGSDGRFDFEHRIARRNGEIRTIHARGTIETDPGSNVVRVVGTSQDITERKRAEELLRQSERTYAEAYEREREAVQRLRDIDQMKDAFLTAVSHELRTPLTTVLGIAQTLRTADEEDRDVPHGVRADMMRRLERQAARLEELLEDLLDVDRLSRGVLQPRRQPTDVEGLLYRVVAVSEAAHHRTVEIVVPRGGVVARVDPAMFERIIENLVGNAVKYTAPGSSIWIRARPEAGGVSIAVEDDGPGLAEDLREAIFEPFQQGPGTPQHAPGVGIGLSLVRRFAELHGGRAWVEDRPGGGACFRVLLPGGDVATRRTPARASYRDARPARSPDQGATDSPRNRPGPRTADT